MLLLLLFSLNFARAAAPPAWKMLDRVPFAALSAWERWTGFTEAPGAPAGRIRLEKPGFLPLILLIDAPYALRGGKFVALSEAARKLNGEILISADSGEILFGSAVKGPERKSLDEALALAKPAPVKPTAVAEAPAAAANACRSSRPVRRIFLDPGHGGDDAGTRHEHVDEKEIVLSFSHLAAEELRRQGFEVSFSRTHDVFLPLDIRTKLAEEWKADLFISLHVNSNPVSGVHGTETYILSPDATDAAARKLALLENSVVKEAKTSSSALQDILWDMEQNVYLQDSAYLASYIQGAIFEHAHDLLLQQKAGDWKNRGVRQAPFYVLSRAPMPAVLVELGYLSNARDRKLLSDKVFQGSLAKALADGVKKYQQACRNRK